MPVPGDWVAVGIDNGGTTNNGTVLTSDGRFLRGHDGGTAQPCPRGPGQGDPSNGRRVRQGARHDRRAEGEGAPRSAWTPPGQPVPPGSSPPGGATNFGHPGWSKFDIRLRAGGAPWHSRPVQQRRQRGRYLRPSRAARPGAGRPARCPRSSARVGGGVVQDGRIVKGAAGMAGELGHMPIPMAGLLEDGPASALVQLRAVRRRESVASLTGKRGACCRTG